MGEIIIIEMYSILQFNTLQYSFKMASPTLQEISNHIQGRRTNFTFSPRPWNSLLVILKTILELDQWANSNQEFRQRTNRKLRGPQRNSRHISNNCYFSHMFSPKLRGKWRWRHLDISLINITSFHLNCVGNGNDDISSEVLIYSSSSSCIWPQEAAHQLFIFVQIF